MSANNSRRFSRRDFLRVSAGVAGGLVLASCGPKAEPTSAPANTPVPEAPAAEPVTIRMITHWHLEDEEGGESKLGFVQRTFQEANPDVTVDIVVIPSWGEADAKTQTECGAGNCPDVAFNGFANIAAVDAGLIIEADDFVMEHEDVIDMDYMGPKYKGHYWAAFSEEINAFVCVYNRALLEDIGFSEFPKTWDEMLQAGEAAKAQGKALTTLRSYWPWVYGWIQEGTDAGAKAMDEGNWDSSTWVDTMAYFQELVPYLSTDELELDDRIAPTRVRDGEMLFYTDGQWSLGRYAYEGTPVEQAEKAASVVGCAPFPSPHGMTVAGWTPYAIGTGAYKHPEAPERVAATWRFLDFWCTDEDTAKMFIMDGSPMGVRTELISEFGHAFLSMFMEANSAADLIHRVSGAWAAADSWGAVQPAFEALTVGQTAEEATKIMMDILRA